MKNIVMIILALIVALIPCAVAEQVGLPNPITEMESLAEVNEVAGVNLAHPAVMGVTEVSFCTIDCGDYVIGQYIFNVAGREYCFRGAVIGSETDISGYYTEDGTAFENQEPMDDGVIAYYFGESDKLARWFDGDIQYVLMLSDCSDAEDEWFEGIAEEMQFVSADVPADTETAE